MTRRNYELVSELRSRPFGLCFAARALFLARALNRAGVLRERRVELSLRFYL